MSQPIAAGAAFAAGLRAEALGTYKRHYAGQQDKLRLIADLDYPSTRREELYFFWNAAPHIVRWLRGQTMGYKGFSGVKYSVTNHRWARAIAWQNEDLQDDQTKDLLNHARALGQSAALVDERAFFQIITAANDIDLLPSVPNAPDGSGLYLTTARFGYANGNQFNKTDLTNVSSVLKDYFIALATFKRFQDGEGQPLFDEGIVSGQHVIVHSPVDEEVISKAFYLNIMPGTTASNAPAISNIIKDLSRKPPILWSTQRVASGSWYIFLADSPTKPLFSQLREGMREAISTMQDSDIAKDTGRESIRFWLRKGFGVHTPYGTVKVN